MGARRVLLDCGAHPGFSDPARRFPDLASLPPLDVVVITHFHLDHAGALPLLRRLQPDVPVVMTAPTRSLAKLMLRDFFDTSAARGETVPFGEDDVSGAFSSVNDVEVGEAFDVPGEGSLRVDAFYAGHVLGAVMFRVSARGVGCVVYSGDYTVGPDVLLRGAEVPVFAESVDLFITETTYCSTVRKTSRRGSECELVDAILATLEAGGKVLIPVSALGRVHEIVALLTPLWAGSDAGDESCVDLSAVPVYVAAALMNRASKVYDAHAASWCGGAASEAANLRMPQLREFSTSNNWEVVETEGPVVMFATPGNLSAGYSLDVFRAWCGDPRNLVVVPGFCFSNAVAGRLGGGMGREVEVRCRLMNMSLAAHADAREIVRTVRRLRPTAVLLVHGEESKIATFEPRLRNALGGQVQVFAPVNGETVELGAAKPGRKKRRRLPDGADELKVEDAAEEPMGDKTEATVPVSVTERAFNTFVTQNVGDDWRQTIEDYRAGAGDKSKLKVEAGLARVPVDDGTSLMDRLFSEFIPDVQRLEDSPVDFTYKHVVTIKLDVTDSFVEATWDDRTHAEEGNFVIAALEESLS